MSFSKTLLKTLKLVSKKGKELERLKKFVHFQKDQEAVGKVFDFLMQHYDTTYNNVTNEMVKAAVFPENPTINDSFLRVYYSHLNELIEQFFIQEELKKDKGLQQQLLAKVYNEKNQFERFETANKTAQREIEKQEDNAFKFSQIAELKQQIFFHPHFKSLERNSIDLLEVVKNIDTSYILGKLKFAVEYLSRGHIYDNKNEIKKLKSLLKLSQNIDFQEDTLIRNYASLVNVYQTNTYEAYKIAKDFHEETKKNLSEKENKSITLHLQNFLIRELNRGNQNVATQILSTYKNGLENKTLFINGQLSETSFLNIVSIACIANDVVFISDFIIDYQDFINSKNKDIVLILAKANFSFCQFLLSKNKDFLYEILTFMSSIKTLNSDIFYNLTQRMTLAKTYFELSFFDENMSSILEYYLNSFLRFLYKSELIPEKKQLYTNFCSTLLQISNLKTCIKSEKSAKKEKLIYKIHNEQMINQYWLLEKIKIV